MTHRGRVGATLAVLAAALLLLHLRSTGEAVPIRKPLDSFPARIGEWQGRGGIVLGPDILGRLKLTDYVLRTYVDGAGRNLSLYVAYWDTQRKGALIHSPKNCLPGAGWEPVEATVLTVPLSAGHPSISVNRYLIQKEREQQVAIYWYQAQGRAIAGEVPARVAMVRSALVRNRTDAAIVRVMSPVYGNVSETSDRLVAYVQAIYPLLGEFLPD
jgi:EpsI family protein